MEDKTGGTAKKIKSLWEDMSDGCTTKGILADVADDFRREGVIPYSLMMRVGQIAQCEGVEERLVFSLAERVVEFGKALEDEQITDIEGITDIGGTGIWEDLNRNCSGKAILLSLIDEIRNGDPDLFMITITRRLGQMAHKEGLMEEDFSLLAQVATETTKRKIAGYFY